MLTNNTVNSRDFDFNKANNVLVSNDKSFDESHNGEYVFESNFQQMTIDNSVDTANLANSVTSPIKANGIAKLPPTYNQYQKQQQLKAVPSITSETKNSTSIPSTTSLPSNNFKVLDLPPPPPYPQNMPLLPFLPLNLSSSAAIMSPNIQSPTSNSATSLKTASVVM